MSSATKVLVVDDAALMRRMLCDILEMDDYHVVGEADNGTLAIQMAKQLKPDLILMDVMMPDINGIEASRQILDFDSEIKIIVVSSIGQDDLIDQAISSGIKSYILKPFRQEDVLQTARIVMSGAQEN